MRRQYDLAVIGGGAAGLTAAGMSALLGAKTALIEERRLGGECTWSGCIPSKTLLRAARAVHDMQTADRFGLAPVREPADFGKIMDHVRRTRESVYQEADAPPNLEKLGVEVIDARARFCDPYTLEIESPSGKSLLTSDRFVIATGSRPKMPSFAGSVLTNETVFELRSLPERLLILGAGPIGTEMAQAFQRLGSEVTVVTRGNRILPRDDPDHAGRLQRCLASEGVSFVFGQQATEVAKRPGSLSVILENGRAIPCDAVLVAIGREPVIDGLQLEKAGVRFGDTGIQVDRRCRTSQTHIYAAGDVTGRYHFTHMSEHMAKVAVTNALLHWPKTLDEDHVPWATFTDPELAHLGKSEQELLGEGRKPVVLRFPFARLDRAITDVAGDGEVKVWADRRGRILGVSILGAHAGEMISEWTVAMRHGIRLNQIGETIHPYPTYMLGNRMTADQFVGRQLDSPFLALLSRVLGYRGQLKGSRALHGQ